MLELKTIEKYDRITNVTVGRLTFPKKMDRVIRLASRLKQEGVDVNFQIVGDGELKNDLLSLRKELDVEDNVQFTGFVKNPFSYIKNADLMLVSSAYEGFGLVVCEAMRSEEHTSELQSRENLVCRLLLEKKNKTKT